MKKKPKQIQKLKRGVSGKYLNGYEVGANLGEPAHNLAHTFAALARISRDFATGTRKDRTLQKRSGPRSWTTLSSNRVIRAAAELRLARVPA